MNRTLRNTIAAGIAGGMMLTGATSALGIANGSGASFPNQAYSKWCADSKLCSYTSKGSTGGITDFVNGVTDFGASDAPLTSTQLAALRRQRGGANVLYFPTLLGGVTVPTNIDGVNKRLKLRGTTIAKIFKGDIDRWNHPEIRAANRGVSLPNESITRCVRADGSGTSFAFTSYLSKVYPQFRTSVGASQRPNWPSNVSVVTGPKNPGVAKCVNDNDNSIGYVDTADARSAGLLDNATAVGKSQVVRRRVRSGGRTRIVRQRKIVYIAPFTKTISRAGNVRLRRNQPLNVSLTNSSAPGAYPITTTTWVLVYSDFARAGKAGSKNDVLRTLRYFYSARAQRDLPKLQFAPLPANLRAAALAQLNRVR